MTEFELIHFYTQLPLEFSSQNGDELLKKLVSLDKIIQNQIEAQPKAKTISEAKGLEITSQGIIISLPLSLEQDFYSDQLKILIKAGTHLEPGAYLKGPTYIKEHCYIGHQAYIRENTWLEARVSVGHASEVKRSIILNNSSIAHFNYVGDSILGAYVNFGAGSKIANLEFRSLADKREARFKKMRLPFKNYPDFTKLGAIIGDGVEVGCGAIIAPGTFIAQNSSLLPNCFVKKGYYVEHSRITPDG